MTIESGYGPGDGSGASDAPISQQLSQDCRILSGRQASGPASSDKMVRLWDLATGAALQTLEGHGNGIHAVGFSLDSKLLASASYDETVRLSDLATGAALQTLEGHSSMAKTVTISPDGKRLASASYWTVRLWDLATGVALQTLEVGAEVSKISFSRDS